MQYTADVLCPPGLHSDTETDSFFSFMSGFAPLSPEATQIDVQTGQELALTSFALELVYDRTLTRPLQGFGDQPTAEQSRLICPDIAAYETSIKNLEGLCDRMYRSSLEPCTDLPMEGRFAARSRFFDQACMCYRPATSEPLTSLEVDDIDFNSRFQTFTEAVCGKVIPEDAYGNAGDIVNMKHKCLDHLRQAAHHTQDLIESMQSIKLVGSCHPGPFESYEEIQRKIDHCVGSKQGDSGFNHQLNERKLSLDSAHAIFDLLQRRVSDHVAKRCAQNHTHLRQMADDVFARTAQHLDAKSAVALMATCVQYSGKHASSMAANLKARVPHIHVRFILGNFPHHRATSRDRQALLHNESKSVQRDFVLTRKAVRIHVDFVTPTLRSTPLKKKNRTDGLGNRHDFPNDEYEEPHESLRRRGPKVSDDHDLNTVLGRSQADGECRVRAKWLAAEGPEEQVDRFMYNKRIPYDTYFSAPLQLTPCLVYADSKEPVPCARFKGGLKLSNMMLRDGGRFSQPPEYGACDQMPASCKFHIPNLSYDHAGRLFCLRLTGTATLAKSGNPFTQVVYTQPFEVVSKLDVIKKAAKRRTAEETSQEAAKRAKSKSTKEQPAARPP